MKKLIKPPVILPGDTVATVSLSWGGAGDDAFRWRYEQGKKRLEDVFGLHVIEMPHTLAPDEYIYSHPEKRAEDLNSAFADKRIKGIFSVIGGEETLRIAPYVDYGIIHDNPKVFLGYSDTTSNHYMCYKAGVSSIYGPALLSDFAENVSMSDYTVRWLRKTLFDTEALGLIEPSDTWTSEHLEWDVKNSRTARRFYPNPGYELIQGSRTCRGHLLGGCMEVFDWLRGTSLFPDINDFDGAILFLETSEDAPPPDFVRWMFRALGTCGVLDRINGLVFGRPYKAEYTDDYHLELKRVLAEFGRKDLPVLCNFNIGHCEPKCCLPIGAMAEINCENKTFSILEGAVV